MENIRSKIGAQAGSNRGSNKIALYDNVDRAFLPKVLAITLAQLNYTKNHNKDARVVMANWTASFSIAEKQRFLGAAAHYPEFVDMAEYMDMLELFRNKGFIVIL